MKEKVLDFKEQIYYIKQMIEVINYEMLEEIDDFYLEMFTGYLSTVRLNLGKFEDFVEFTLIENEKKKDF